MYVTAFVQPISGEVFWYVSNGISKPFFAALLALFAREAGAGRDRIIVLGLDSAGWHTAPNLVVPEGLRLVYLPPYSPELQPAEHLWPILDEPLANRYFETLAWNARSQTVAGSSEAISSASGQTSKLPLVAQASHPKLISRRS